MFYFTIIIELYKKKMFIATLCLSRERIKSILELTNFIIKYISHEETAFEFFFSKYFFNR